MSPLNSITGLSPDAADLLEAAGFRSPAHLALQNAEVLHKRLEMLAWQRGKAHQSPPREVLEEWIAAARAMTSPGERETIDVDDIPEAVSYETSSPAWMPPAVRAAAEANTTAGAGPVRPQVPVDTSRRIDPSRFATIEQYNEGRMSVQPLSRDSLYEKPAPAAASEDGAEAEEAAPVRKRQRIRSQGEELSRWVKRGVVHPRPFHTWLGALVSVLWRLAMVTAIGLLSWLLLTVKTPGDYKDEVILGFVILGVLSAMQLHFVGRSRCRICSCNLYFSKNCLKNRKAHLLFPLGYVASAALHLLIFGWFRCMYCGTAVRLKATERE